MSFESFVAYCKKRIKIQLIFFTVLPGDVMRRLIKLQGKNFDLFVFFAVYRFLQLIPAMRWDLLHRPKVSRLDVTWCIRFFV